MCYKTEKEEFSQEKRKRVRITFQDFGMEISIETKGRLGSIIYSQGYPGYLPQSNLKYIGAK
jgi:hypothetical protein